MGGGGGGGSPEKRTYDVSHGQNRYVSRLPQGQRTKVFDFRRLVVYLYAAIFVEGNSFNESFIACFRAI